jgi:hypothetical protein
MKSEEESMLKRRLFATLRVTAITFYTVSIPSGLSAAFFSPKESGDKFIVKKLRPGYLPESCGHDGYLLESYLSGRNVLRPYKSNL